MKRLHKLCANTWRKGTGTYTKVQVLSLAQLSNFLSFKICTTCAVSCRDEWPVHVQLHSWLPGGLQVPHPPRIRWVEFYTNTAVKEIPGAILLLNGKLWEFIIYICSSATLFHYFYLIYLSWYYIICLSNLSLNCETEKGKLKKFINTDLKKLRVTNVPATLNWETKKNLKTFT